MLNNYESELEELIRQQKIMNIYLEKLTKIAIRKTSLSVYAENRIQEMKDEIRKV